MNQPRSLAQRIRYYSNLTTIYLLTILCAWFVIYQPGRLEHSRNVSLTRAEQKPRLLTDPNSREVSGRPVRLVIPGSSYNGVAVDLPVDEGYYDSTSDSWTLAGYHAEFAMISTLANNFAGDTYIYGHNNDSVFGALRHKTPNTGSTAYVYTDNGHIFAYSFLNASSVAPDVTSVLQYNGPPIMTIQTCTGSFNEARTLYKYTFDRVIQ